MPQMAAANTQVKGDSLTSVVQAVSRLSEAYRKRVLDVLDKNGVPEPQVGEWYSLPAAIDSLDELVDGIGPRTVKTIGKEIPETVEWPPQIDSVEAGLTGLDDVYQMYHRGGDVGYYEFEKTGETEGRMICETPYPSPMDQGIVEGIVKKFNDSGAFVEVERDETASKRTFDVSW
ncbi:MULTISPECIES: hypothetical protein [Haladaptatus]|uniref:Uncharacterized protein n=2 Tax=Haladaptatus paucihalophilus TaxID=367189 RepID=A0A1M6TCQ7_HALPU|nr:MULTISPECIES: hypothetical protein [Haladaptatus]GKZ12821.1 hypothetical protein HAL_07020 [Haladaptatus sp. T7]SHK54760.1 hypothetical protein SAMN05444342_1628 [Haladaptatus paucihalophilus DX253]